MPPPPGPIMAVPLIPLPGPPLIIMPLRVIGPLNSTTSPVPVYVAVATSNITSPFSLITPPICMLSWYLLVLTAEAVPPNPIHIPVSPNSIFPLDIYPDTLSKTYDILLVLDMFFSTIL